MTLTIPSKKLVFVGDLHGRLHLMVCKIGSYRDTCFVLCGDVGFGFNKKSEEAAIEQISGLCEETNNYVMAIRGNHDDPELFDGVGNRFIKLVDNTILHLEALNEYILCVGGGISIDRRRRIEGVSYWANEPCVPLLEYNPKVTIIASHIAPHGVFPYTYNDIVESYCKIDPNLNQDLTDERNLLSKLFTLYRDSILYWYYGHYHASNTEYLKNTKFTLLNINEYVEHSRSEDRSR